LADGKVSRRERGLLVFTCYTRRRDKVDVVNYMASKGEQNLEVHGCVLFTNHKLKFIQGPLKDDRSSRASDLNFCFEFRRSCFWNFGPENWQLHTCCDCPQFSRKMLTASFHVLFQYVIRRCDIGGSALTNVCLCLDYSTFNCHCHSDGGTYLSATYVQYLTVVSGWLLDRRQPCHVDRLFQ